MILQSSDDIDALLDAGEITLEDAGEAQAFMDFLADAPRPILPHEREPGFHGPFPSENVDFLTRWGDYMEGKA